MKKGLIICTPDVAYGPLALLSGTFEQKSARAAALGFDGVELMVRDPALLDWSSIKGALDKHGLDIPQIVTGELFGADGLGLITSDEALHRRAVERAKAIIDLAAFLSAMVNVGRFRGRLDWLTPAERTQEIATEKLREVISYAASLDVKIVIEPVNRYEVDFLFTVADGLRLIDHLNLEPGADA